MNAHNIIMRAGDNTLFRNARAENSRERLGVALGRSQYSVLTLSTICILDRVQISHGRRHGDSVLSWTMVELCVQRERVVGIIVFTRA